MHLSRDLVERVRAALDDDEPSPWRWEPHLDSSDETAEGEVVIEIDHTDDDPGPENVQSGELKPLGEEA